MFMKFPCVYNNFFPVSKVSLQIEDVGSPSKEYPTKYHYSSPHVSKYQTSFSLYVRYFVSILRVELLIPVKTWITLFTTVRNKSTIVLQTCNLNYRQSLIRNPVQEFKKNESHCALITDLSALVNAIHLLNNWAQIDRKDDVISLSHVLKTFRDDNSSSASLSPVWVSVSFQTRFSSLDMNHSLLISMKRELSKHHLKRCKVYRQFFVTNKREINFFTYKN